MSFNKLSSLRFSYQLLYLRTVLQGKLISPVNVSSYDLLRSKNTFMSSHFLLSFVRKSFIIPKRSRYKFKSLRIFTPLIKNYKVPARVFSFFKSHRISFILSFVNLLKKASSFRRSLRNINSLLYPSLRLINLSFNSGKSFISPSNSHTNVLLKMYTLFLFLYPSCQLDEVRLNTLLHFISNKCMLSFSSLRQSVILNRFAISSFFFRSIFGKNRSSRFSFSKKRNKLKQRFYASSRKFLCSLLRNRSNLRFRFKDQCNTIRHSRLKLIRRNYKKVKVLKSVLSPKKLMLFNSYRWFSFSNSVPFVFNTNEMRTFVTRLNQLIYRSSILSVQSRSHFTSLSNSIPSSSNSIVSHTSLLSFYKKRRLSQMRRFLKRIRFLNKHTYYLYLKGTGSNIYSTFLRKNRVLYSMWSGLFGFKKRLKYRKGAGHKISHFFHRYISVLYRKKRIYKLNLIINGFSKFFSICLDAFGRQLAYTANYYLNFDKYPQRIFSMMKCVPSYYSNRSKKKWSSSFLRSFVSPFVSSHLSVNLNNDDLSLFVPELTTDELLQLVNIVRSDNVQRSNLLLRLIRTRRYKKRSISFIDSYSAQRSALITKLITVFMARYGISSKKDFYKSVSYLNKYKSIIFNSMNVDKSDFVSAYSIIYLLQILKQNKFYFNKIMSYSTLLRRRFGLYLKKVRFLKSKFRKIRRKKKKLYFFFKKSKSVKRRLHKLEVLKKKQKRLLKKIRFFLFKNKKKLLVSSPASSSMKLSSLFELFSYRLLRSAKFKKVVRRLLLSKKESLKTLLFRLFCLFLKRSLKKNVLILRSRKMNRLLNFIKSSSFLKLRYKLRSRYKPKFRSRSKSKLKSKFKSKSKFVKPLKKKKFKSFKKKGFNSRKKLFVRNYITNTLRSLINSSKPVLRLARRRPKRLRSMIQRLFRTRRRLFLIKRFPRKRIKKARLRFMVRKRPRGYFFYKKNVKRRRRFSKICRLIRTRMRNFTQLIYSVGYVKYRASLSHGGCASRKRYYDKRYI